MNGKVEHTCAPKAKTRILRATPEKAEDEKARPFAPIISDGEVRENECPACGNLMAGPPGARMCPHCSG